MKKKIKIAPSILASNFSILGKEIVDISKAGADYIHFDIMDGNFVNNLTFGPFIINHIREVSDSHFETHLMISNPHRYLMDYIKSGSDTLIIHYEASTDIKRDLNFIRDNGVLSGIAINPNTDYKLILNLSFEF